MLLCKGDQIRRYDGEQSVFRPAQLAHTLSRWKDAQTHSDYQGRCSCAPNPAG